ncbi:MAG TPA: DUF192 domain-containing protein [Candidatus Kryptobacter bacterium]|nr:DUF192 domain-containing protein [Candidatus Kryptobacter bacterium]
MQNRIYKHKNLMECARVTRITSLIAVVVMLPLLAASFGQQSTNGPSASDGPQFKDDGQLVFLKRGTNATIKLIQIQIADNDEERAQGLMWRKFMPEDDGMLFIFGDEEPLTFWMKNTYIPLDMVFADKSGNIVSIYSEATPLSEASIPSGKPAEYVVEVNGGFCARYGVTPGDKIEYER